MIRQQTRSVNVVHILNITLHVPLMTDTVPYQYIGDIYFLKGPTGNLLFYNCKPSYDSFFM